MRVTGEIDRGMVHIAPGENYEWVYDFQRSLGRTITWSSILTYPPEWKSRAPSKGKLDRHTARARDAGADVWVQVTCRPIVQQILMNEPTPFYSLPAFADRGRDRWPSGPRSTTTPRGATRVTEEFESSKWVNPRWETFTRRRLAGAPRARGSLGRRRSLASAAARRSTSSPTCRSTTTWRRASRSPSPTTTKPASRCWCRAKAASWGCPTPVPTSARSATR